MKTKNVTIFILCLYSTFSFSQNNVSKSDTILKQIDKNNILISYPQYNDYDIKLKLDENNNLVFTKIVENLNLSKDEIYVKAFSYFAYNYKDAKSVIQQQDKDAGIIIGKGFYSEFSKFNKSRDIGMGIAFTTYDSYGAVHILRINIKDGKARIVLTVDNYEVNRSVSSSKSTGSMLLTGSAGIIPYKNLTTISKLIVNCPPIDSRSISDRTTENLLAQGVKKASKAVSKSVVESVTFDCESEANAFPELLQKAISTISNFEKSLIAGNNSKETENW